MIWALLAAFLTKRPAWVQAVVVGLCTGLFVAAGAHANQRDPLISSVVLLVLAVAVVAGVGFHLALRARLRHGWAAGSAPPTWVNLVYAAVWLLSLIAAIRALFGAGGLKVAVLAIVTRPRQHPCPSRAVTGARRRRAEGWRAVAPARGMRIRQGGRLIRQG